MSDVERSDAPPGRIALALSALVAALLLVCAAVAGLMIVFDRRTPPDAGPPPLALRAPEPRLQANERIHRDALEKRTQAARPRIEAAMARVAREGWPR